MSGLRVPGGEAGNAAGGTAIAATGPAGIITGGISGFVGALLDRNTERDCLRQRIDD